MTDSERKVSFKVQLNIQPNMSDGDHTWFVVIILVDIRPVSVQLHGFGLAGMNLNGKGRVH